METDDVYIYSSCYIILLQLLEWEAFKTRSLWYKTGIVSGAQQSWKASSWNGGCVQTKTQRIKQRETEEESQEMMTMLNRHTKC